MRIIIKFSPEIIIKSRSVRIFFIKILITNIKIILKKHNKLSLIVRHWDYLEVMYNNDEKVFFLLQNIPGIHHFLLVKKNVFNSLKDIYEKVICIHTIDTLEGKTFCIRVKRSGNHVFTSRELECYLGDKICKNVNNVYVKLRNPEKFIFLEIKDNYLFIVIQRYEGLGGFPMGTQQELLSLISGGFDSAVSSYMLMRRGCKVHYCFFNFGGVTYAEEVYKVAYHLWNRFGRSHKVRFISIDFSEVVKEILATIKYNQIGIVLKRMMIRAASSIASHFKIKALLTGEVLGQVSSQTMDNLSLINHVSNYMILRPLISCDKEKIIALAKKIGTEEFSKVVPEYCAIVSKKSSVKSTEKCIKFEESRFNFMILDQAVSQINVLNIQDVLKKILHQSFFKIEIATTLCCNDVVLDIRAEEEQEKYPFFIEGIKVEKMPFYKLKNEFPQLNQNKTYLLFCSHGIMSRLQAIYLRKQGFYNVKIYRAGCVL